MNKKDYPPENTMISQEQWHRLAGKIAERHESHEKKLPGFFVYEPKGLIRSEIKGLPYYSDPICPQWRDGGEEPFEDVYVRPDTETDNDIVWEKEYKRLVCIGTRVEKEKFKKIDTTNLIYGHEVDEISFHRDSADYIYVGYIFSHEESGQEQEEDNMLADYDISSKKMKRLKNDLEKILGLLWRPKKINILFFYDVIGKSLGKILTRENAMNGEEVWPVGFGASTLKDKQLRYTVIGKDQERDEIILEDINGTRIFQSDAADREIFFVKNIRRPF